MSCQVEPEHMTWTGWDGAREVHTVAPGHTYLGTHCTTPRTAEAEAATGLHAGWPLEGLPRGLCVHVRVAS